MSGLALNLGDGLTASVHPDGSLSLDRDGAALDFTAEQVERLAALLKLAGPLIARQVRKRAAADYQRQYGE